MSSDDSGESDYASGGEIDSDEYNEAGDVDILDDSDEDRPKSTKTSTTTSGRTGIVIPETPPKPPKSDKASSSSKLTNSSLYDPDDFSPVKSQTTSSSPWSGKPAARYSGPAKSGGLLSRVFGNSSTDTDGSLQTKLDAFKFKPAAAHATTGKRPRPEHIDPAAHDAESWVETRPEKRMKLEESEDIDDALVISPQITPQKDLKRLRTGGASDDASSQERRLPTSLFGNGMALPAGRTLRKRTVASYTPPKSRGRSSKRDDDEDSMEGFIVQSDEDSEDRRKRHKRYANSAYKPGQEDDDEELAVDQIMELDDEDEEEEEEEVYKKKRRHGKRLGRPPKRRPAEEEDQEDTQPQNGSQSSGRLKRLRKTGSDANVEPIILDISSDEEKPESNVITLDIPDSNEENGVMVLDGIEDEQSDNDDEEDEEEDADEETIVALDSIIQRTDDYTLRLRERLAEMKIDDRKSTILQSDDATFERQPACLKHKLKDYQLVGINWMYLLNQEGLNGILADEMGLGKTIQSIALLSLIYEKGDYGPHLVVVPASTLSNWERELRKWAPSLNVCQYYGTQQERAYIQDELSRERRRQAPGQWAQDCYNIVLTTYQMATRKEDAGFLRKFNFSYMILDEAQNIKNQGSQRYKNLFKQRTKRRLLLTGTPLQNNLEELWALLQFLMPSLFGNMDFKPISSQLARLKRTEPKSGKRVEAKYVQRMKKCLQPFILRRLKMQIGLHLKPKVVEVFKCALTETQKSIYTTIFNRSRVAFLQQAQAEGDSGIISMSSFLQNVLMQLRKTANHPALVRAFYSEAQILEIAKLLKAKHDDWNKDPLAHIVEDLQAYSDYQIHTLAKTYNYLAQYRLTEQDLFYSSTKFLELMDKLPALIAEDHRILLFSQMTRVLDILEPFLDHLGIRWIRLDGQTAVSERQELIDEFNNDHSVKVFLLSTRAGGLGINLTSADTVIFYDIAFNPQVDRQAEDRCHRLGQEKEVKIIKLVVEGSCEEQIFEMAKEKHELNDVVLGEGKYAAAEDDDDAASDGANPEETIIGDEAENIDENVAKSIMGSLFSV